MNIHISKTLLFGFLLLTFSCANEKSQSKNDHSKEFSETKVVNIEEQLFNLLNDWLQSQNEGDFTKYQSFYGTSFKGIKRAGTNEYVFDREGWLSDRKRMFQREMKVRATQIQINYKSTPYKLVFNQDWRSGSFSDYGAKQILVDHIDNTLKILKEEMLESILSNTKGDANNALNHKNFYLREGNKVIIQKSLHPGQRVATELKCIQALEEHDVCVKVHDYNVDTSKLDSLDIKFLNRNVIFGHIEDSLFSHGLTKEYRMVMEELVDSLSGIAYEANMFQPRYRWKGGTSKLADYHSVLFCETMDKVKVTSGQWAYVSDTDPMVYNKRVIKEQNLRSDYLSKIDGKEDEDVILFSQGNRVYLVSFRSNYECGETYYDNIKLWNAVGDTFLFTKDLPDLPIMILDLDRDGDLDMLYKNDFEFDPAEYIQWESPYYYLHGVDTVFAGCGC